MDVDDLDFDDEDFAPRAATKASKAKAAKPVAAAARTALKDVTSSAAGSAPAAAPAAKGKAKSGSKTVEEIYQKMTQLEHILLRPDSYVGSIHRVLQPMWVYDAAKEQIVNRKVSYVPGLFKIFDEILVNAADNKTRDPKGMTEMRVVIDPAANIMSVWNNGKGIPIVMHGEHHVYVPELIFGHLLTSSNYDDEERKVTGGRNGYGAKLANIFSTSFTVEVADSSRKLLYKQTFSKNMNEKTAPSITPLHGGSDYVCITFSPDLPRFGMEALDDDIVSLLSKRVVDIAGVSRGLRVTLNGSVIPINGFKEYVGMYITDDAPRVWERVNDRWEVCLTLTDGSFSQVSFVNSINTSRGGTHVSYISDQIAEAVAAEANRKNKGVEVKASHVANYMMLFINASIENPAFSSQTKEILATREKDFGSTAVLGTAFMKQVMASGIVERVQSWARYKATAELQKASNVGKKAHRFVGIPKLDDANHAGTAKAADCTLILTEGDSAKSLAIAGLSVVGRDYFGVFPLKGKLLNVREASHKQIMGNTEIQNIVTILGLKYGEVYDGVKGLRYGHIMIMADQDGDGSHIKGLLINVLHTFWPSLLKISGFLREFITPIVKCIKGKESHTFFTLPEYYTWKAEKMADAGAAAGTKSGEAAMRGWSIKYYKGLGTSTAAEAKEYFAAIDRHEIDFEMDDIEESGHNADDLIDLAFSKKRADDRKEWLRGFVPGTFVDYDTHTMLMSNFIHKELILFSIADNVRSIPSLVDGLKPAQRKVLYACFKRNLKTDIKVAQLAGYVSEHSAYHHGEASLAATIVGMAQNFVGSNNINLLVPSGQFGTRLMGGKDAASPRYIFTRLAPITRAIFPADDDALLAYLDDDGQSIEPSWYLPVIPLVLVNGAEGIGTGWSTSVPNYNPRDVIAAMRARIRGDSCEPLVPWYRGFTGAVTRKDASHFTASGIGEVMDGGDKLVVTELPVCKWTQDYKQMLVTMITGEAAAEVEKKAAGVKTKGKPVTAAAKAKAAAAKAKKAATTGLGTKAAVKKTSAKAKPAAAAAAVAEEEGGKVKRKAASKPKKKAAEDDDDDDDVDFMDEDDDDDFNGGDDGEDDDDDAFEAAPAKKKAAPKAAAAKKEAAPKKEVEPIVPPGEPLVKEFTENHTDTTVSFTVKLTAACAKLAEPCSGAGVDGLTTAFRKVFKLDTSLSTTNMHLFDAAGMIKRYNSPEEILDEFYALRITFYEKRKEHLLGKLSDEVEKLANRARFILAVVHGDFVVSNRKKVDLLAELHDAGYKGFEAGAEDGGELDEEAMAATSVARAGKDVDVAVLSRRYHYLLSMPLWSLTLEKVNALRAELAEKEAELTTLRATLPSDMWLTDLDALEKALDVFDADEAASRVHEAGARRAYARGKPAAKGKKPAARKPRKRAADSDDDDDDDDDMFDGEDDEYEAKPKKAAAASKKAAPAAAPAVKATAKPAASKAAAATKPAAISKVAAAPAPAPAVEDDLDLDFGFGGASLSARLAAVLLAPAPAPAPAPIKKVAASAKATVAASKPVKAAALPPAEPVGDARPRRAATKATYVVEDDDDDDVELHDEDDDDGDAEEDEEDSPVAKKRAPPKKKAEAAAPKAVKRAASDERAGAPVRGAAASAVLASPIRTSPLAKKAKAAASKKAAPKPRALKLDDDDEDAVEEVVAAAPRAAAPRRAAAVTKKYVEESDEEEDDDDEEEEDDWDDDEE